MDEFELIEQFKPGAATSVAEVLARAAAMPDRAEIEEAAAERAAADARAEQRETQAMLNRMAGDPIGNVSRCQQAVAEARDQVADLESQLEAARGRLNRAAENLVTWSDAADEVHRASVQRSSRPDLLGPAKQVLAEQRVERMLAERAAHPQQARRPKDRGGVAVRSDQPVTCKDCLKYGATPEQSFLIHSDPAPEPVPAIPSEEERDWLNSLQGQAERRTYGYAEAVR